MTKLRKIRKANSMTKLRNLRIKSKLTLREVGKRAGGVTPQTVHDAEVRGVRTPRKAMQYAVAFPGHTWQDLMEEPEITASH